jgi:hypothetical protein
MYLISMGKISSEFVLMSHLRDGKREKTVHGTVLHHFSQASFPSLQIVGYY